MRRSETWLSSPPPSGRRVPRRRRGRRDGYVLVWFSLVLVLLMGLVGLVVDGGMLTSTYRQARNAADAAALAAAKDLFAGRGLGTARTTAENFVHTHNGLAGATVVVNNPPLNGAYAGNTSFVEVIVTHQVNNYFVQLSPSTTHATTVRARAVAGTEDLAKGEAAVVLDPTAKPGLSITGGATLKVDGAVLINARGAGYNQDNAWLTTGYPQYAATAATNSHFKAHYVQVFGGVDSPANFENYTTGGPNPLYAGYAAMIQDPKRQLPIPTTDLNGGALVQRANVSVNSGSTTLNPGIYGDIKISNNAKVTFNPGIYVLRPGSANESGLTVTGSPTITANGVMFYVTGSSYVSSGHSNGYYDVLDGSLDGPLPPNYGSNTLPAAPDPGNVKWASVNINATSAQVTMTGIQDVNSPYHDMLFFQRRRNKSDFTIQGNAGTNVNLDGAVYAKWANLKLAGGGRYSAQFLVGSMALSGQADVTILGLGAGSGLANEVFLVE